MYLLSKKGSIHTLKYVLKALSSIPSALSFLMN